MAAEAEAVCAGQLRGRPAWESGEDSKDTVARLALEARALRDAVLEMPPIGASAESSKEYAEEFEDGISDVRFFFEEIQHYSDGATKVVRHLERHPEDVHADEIAEGDPGWTDFSEELWSLKMESFELGSSATSIGARSCGLLTLRF